MAVPDVQVRRHVVTCRVVGTATTGDRAVRAALSEDWDTRVDEAFGGAGVEGYWVIRRLAVTAQVGSAWTSQQVAGRLAVGTVQELRRRTGARSDPDALWFPDRAAYLAQYLADLAAGRAGGRWEYAQLAGLGPGPDGLVALARAERDTLVEALLQLGATELHQLVEAVSATVEERLLAALGGDGLPTPRLLLPALRRLLRAGRAGVGTGTALLLALTASRDDGVSLEHVAAPAVDVAGLLGLRRRAGSDWRSLLADLEDGRWGDASRPAGPDGVLPFVRWSPQDRSALVDALADPARTAPVGDGLDTPFGGAFLLLPLLDELWSWPAATQDWPRHGATSAVGVAKLVTLTAALGRGSTVAVADDPLVRLAVGGYGGDLTGLAAWTQSLSAAQVRGFATAAGGRLVPEADAHTSLAAPFRPSPGADLLGRVARSALLDLGRRLPGMASASAAYLWHNVLDIPAHATVEDETAVVELGHPPLSVLLSVTGLNRGEFVVEGAGERRWMLTTRS